MKFWIPKAIHLERDRNKMTLFFHLFVVLNYKSKTL